MAAAMAVQITIIGSSDRRLEELVRASGIRPAVASAVDLLGLTHPGAAQPFFGGDYKVDEFPFNYGYADSPVVTIKVRITADPPLRHPAASRASDPRHSA